ncbi:MAG: tetratricopeptide repeat protein [Myxococcales bacterium]
MTPYRHLAFSILVVIGAFASPGFGSAQPAQQLTEGEPGYVPPDLEQVKRGDLSPPGAIDEAHPERSVPTPEQALKKPLDMGYLMMDLIARAEAASQRGDHAAAVRYYQAIAKAVPERAVSFSKMCRSYKELGDLEHAIESCKTALGLGGVTADDYAVYVRLMLARDQAPSSAEVQELDAVMAHLDKEMGVELAAKQLVAQLRCELALRLEDEDRLRTCVDTFRKLSPQDPRTFTYAWALALQEREFEKAEQIVRDAKQAGLPTSATKEMEAKLVIERAKVPTWLRFGSDMSLVVGLGTALVLALVFTLIGKRGSLRPSA